MNLSRSILKLCESIHIDEASIRHNVKYYTDSTQEYKYIIDCSSAESDRLEFIQNSIQDKIDSNNFKKFDTKIDNQARNELFKSPRGEVSIYYNDNSVLPSLICFSNNQEADEFYKLSTIDDISPASNISPEDDNQMNPGDFALSNETGSEIEPGSSSRGDDQSSTNFG